MRDVETGCELWKGGESMEIGRMSIEIGCELWKWTVHQLKGFHIQSSELCIISKACKIHLNDCAWF